MQRPFTQEQEERIKALQKEAIAEFFKENGNVFFKVLINIGVGAGALTAIFALIQMLRGFFKI
jgi:hypothetical protein